MTASEPDMEQKGIVFHIQKYSVHDGPGIRTNVFLKGCPLRCRWCANPESQLAAPQLAWNQEECIGCKCCVDELKTYGCQFVDRDGLHWTEPETVDQKKVEHVCPTGAFHVIGKEMTVSEVLDEVEQDDVFYENSGGGLTLSGGEPLMQPDFATGILKEAKRRHIHRSLETSGYASWDIVKRVVGEVDYLLMDIKCIDDEIHRAFTGVSNELIINNLKRIRGEFQNLRIHIRTPVIPGVNDTEEEIRTIADFLWQIPDVEYELLKYHQLGKPKYQSLKRPWLMGEDVLSEENFRRLCALPCVQRLRR